ncbi:MAG: phosphoserine phosphatase SerB [Bowdeniella nasicola]|nr:phosphoserine phosphatase SerB [Bowdeniella nasicola]
MIDHRLTLVAEADLPEHLLPDVEHTLTHVGWIALTSARRRRVHPKGDLAIVDYRGHVPPLVPTHADHDHDAMFTELLSGLGDLGVTCLHVAGDLASMPPGLVVLDMDSTLINEEGLDELAALAERQGYAPGAGAAIARTTERAMAGELDFSASLRERVKALRGIPLELFARARPRLNVTTGAYDLVDAIHAAGGAVGVVSGGFHELIDPLLDELGVDFRAANHFAVRDGRVTGVRGPIVDAAAKAECLREWAREAGARRTAAIGDGANDLDMVRAASIGVGFCPKPALAIECDAVVPFRRLDAVAELLGYL